MDETTGFMRSPDPSEYEPGFEPGTLTNDDPGREYGADVTDVYVTGAPTGDTDTDTAQNDTAQIRRGIEQTRSDMSQTIDTIQDRLNPRHLADQARDAVRDATIGKAGQVMNNVTDAARDTGSGILAAIRQNPLPAALAGIGLGWLFMQARDAGTRARQWNDGSSRYRPLYGDSSYRQGMPYSGYRDRGTGPSAGERAQNMANQLSDKAQNAASQVSDQAQQAGNWVQDQAQQAADQAQYQARQVQSWLARTMDESPLVLGLVALAAGSLTGLAIPETQQEHQLMGPARDTLVQQAQGAAQDAMDKVQHVSDEARKAASQEAQKQNLM